MAKKRARELSKLIEPLRVAPGSKVDLEKDYDPAFKTGGLNKTGGETYLKLGMELLDEYQERLAAQDTYGLLVVIQGIDASGKDGTIRHVMRGVNPQGVVVHSFKIPSDDELDHDYLWRYACRVPARGQIAVFNRSHYEEVLVVRVHPDRLEREKLPPDGQKEDLWHRRFREINTWERYLVDNGIRVVKLFLNLSREEQRVRFLARIDQPEKNWKFSIADVQERACWDDYQHAFSAMLTHTSTEWAPWHVIPADHKWFARIAASAVIVDALAEIDPQYPAAGSNAAELEAARVELEAQAPPPSAI